MEVVDLLVVEAVGDRHLGGLRRLGHGDKEAAAHAERRTITDVVSSGRPATTTSACTDSPLPRLSWSLRGDRLAADGPGIEHGRAVGVDQAELAGLGKSETSTGSALPAFE